MSPQLDTAFIGCGDVGGVNQRAVFTSSSHSFRWFTFGHVFMVLMTGVLNNMRSIVTGCIRKGF